MGNSTPLLELKISLYFDGHGGSVMPHGVTCGDFRSSAGTASSEQEENTS